LLGRTIITFKKESKGVGRGRKGYHTTEK